MLKIQPSYKKKKWCDDSMTRMIVGWENLEDTHSFFLRTFAWITAFTGKCQVSREKKELRSHRFGGSSLLHVHNCHLVLSWHLQRLYRGICLTNISKNQKQDKFIIKHVSNHLWLIDNASSQAFFYLLTTLNISSLIWNT